MISSVLRMTPFWPLKVMQENKGLLGVNVGRLWREEDLLESELRSVLQGVADGSFRPIVDLEVPLAEARRAHERLEQTGVRTPLGEVVIVRLGEPGAIEVAGPSAAGDVLAVSEAMLALGAEQVLIDGAIDRRAASSPAVADALVVATGAVLARELDEVVAATAQAIDVIRLPLFEPARDGSDGSVVAVGRELVLRGEPAQVAALLRTHPQEGFLEGLLAARRERAGRELEIVVADPTRAFLSRRGPRWYAKAGISLAVLDTIDLKAITVNPVAPMSHDFDSRELRERISEAVGDDVPVIDVRETA